MRLGLPLTFEMSEESLLSGEERESDRLVLRLTCEGLELIKPDDRKLSGALRVDFTAGHAAFRRKQQKKELLVRAVGGWSFTVPVSKRPLYHAAASMAFSASSLGTGTALPSGAEPTLVAT